MVFVGFSYGTSKSILDSLKAVYGQRYLIKLKVYGCIDASDRISLA